MSQTLSFACSLSLTTYLLAYSPPSQIYFFVDRWTSLVDPMGSWVVVGISEVVVVVGCDRCRFKDGIFKAVTADSGLYYCFSCFGMY